MHKCILHKNTGADFHKKEKKERKTKTEKESETDSKRCQILRIPKKKKPLHSSKLGDRLGKGSLQSLKM